MEDLKKLRQLQGVVKNVLEEKPETRRSDTELIIEVFRRSGVDTSESFISLARRGQLKQMESITRARRKVQEEHPELKDATTAALRAENEETFRAFAKCSGE
jgi:hypothetical protein